MVETRKIGAAPTALLQALEGTSGLTVDVVMGLLGLNRRQFNEAFRRLQIRGYATMTAEDFVTLSETGAEAAGRGEVITGGPKGRVKIVSNTFRQRCWLAMRVRRTFTIGEIVADAATDADAKGQPRDNAARYIRRLWQAEYVTEEGRRVPGTAPSSNGFKRFRLVRNTGPRAPIFCEGPVSIHDPNTGEDVLCRKR